MRPITPIHTAGAPATLLDVSAQPAGASRVVLGGLFSVAAGFLVLGVLLGPLASLLVFAVPTTFAMPVLAAVADWEAGTSRLIGRSAAAINTLLVALGAVVLTLLAALVVGPLDLRAALATAPQAPAHGLTTFPYLIPLGALTFVTFLQVSIVSEGRQVLPRRFGPRAGPVVVAVCFVIAIVAYLLLANWQTIPARVKAHIALRDPQGPFAALDIATWLITVTIWQTAHNVLAGWPYSLVKRRSARVTLANVAVVGLGTGSYLLARGPLGVSGPQLAAAGAVFVAGASLANLLLSEWQTVPETAGKHRARLIALALSAAGYVGLHALGLALERSWTKQAPVELWMVICGLNLIGGTVLWYTHVLRHERGPPADQASAQQRRSPSPERLQPIRSYPIANVRST